MAEHLGMCFGVRDAIDMALALARRGPVTILGDLVHNDAQRVSECLWFGDDGKIPVG